MPRWKKWSYTLLGLILLSMLVVALVLPTVIRTQAIDWVADNTRRQLTIDRIGLNPLTWGVSLDGVALSEADAATTFVAFDRLSFHVSPRSLFELAPVINDLELVNPRLAVVRDADGRFNFDDLITAPPATQPAPEADKPGGVRFALNNLVIHGGAADFTDLAHPELTHQLRELEVALPFLGNTPALAERFVEPNLSLRLDDAPFAASGEVKPFSETLTSTLNVQIEQIDLPYYAGYLPADLGFRVATGHLGLDLTVSYQIRTGNLPELLLDGDINVTGLRLHDTAGADLIFLPLTQVHIDQADLFANRLAFGEIFLNKPELFVRRDADGRVNLLQLAPAATTAAPAAPAAPAPTSADETPALSLERLRLVDGRVHIVDTGGKSPLQREIADFNLQLDRFDLRADTATPYQIDLTIADPAIDGKGSVNCSGTLQPAPLQLTASLQTSRVPLHGLDAYLPPDLSAQVRRGTVDGTLELAVDGRGPAPRISLRGDTGIRDLQVYEPRTQSDLLTWESLQFNRLDFLLADGEPRLRLAEVVLNSFVAGVLVTRDGRVNLQQLLVTEATETPAKAPTATPEPAPEPGPPADLRIDALVLQDGQIHFVDQHLQNPFEARLSSLGGRISNLDARSPEPATLDLRGRLDNVAPLRIDGRINPFGTGLFADLQVRFDAIDLAPVTPYSGTYLGYAIEKGKLFLDLDYRVDGQKLSAGNRVFVDQFTFGDKIESDQATALPVRLAVALLKDRKGEIHLDLPVKGSLDDPQFSVVGVVFDILKNLLVKAATSPFALLASLVGGGEDFDSITFAPGSAALDADEQSKLDRLIAALIERPGLKLEVSGYIDQERDPEGFRHAELERRLVRAGGKSVLTATERSRALGQVYKQADFPKPRNFIGLVKSLPDPEMEKLLLAHTEAGETQMTTLAQQRAKAVATYLAGENRLPPGRVFLKQDDIHRPPDGDGTASRVGFGIGVN